MPTYIIQITCMLLLAGMNIAVLQWRSHSGQTRDTRRLQIALATELFELAELCRINAARLGEGKGTLMSLRAAASVYRANLGRVTILPEQRMAMVIAAYTRSERMEHLVAATCKMQNGFSYRTEEATPSEALIDEFEAIADLALEAGARLADGAVPLRSRLHDLSQRETLRKEPASQDRERADPSLQDPKHGREGVSSGPVPGVHAEKETSSSKSGVGASSGQAA